MRTFKLMLPVLCMAAFSGSAFGVALTFSAQPPLYQQTTSSPCIFGGNNCQNPANFAFSPTPTGSQDTTFSGTQTYTLANYPTVFTTGFIVGVDLNDTGNAQTINTFTIAFNGPNATSYELAAPVSRVTQNNGVGYSDFLFTLGGNAIPIPAGATTVTFTTTWSNLNDGADRFFIVPLGAPTVTPPPNDNPVPEPSSILLVGTAGAALAFLRKRNFKLN